MAHTVFTLHYITSRFQSGVMFLPGRRLYLHTERDAEPRRLGKHTVCARVRSDIYDGECASTTQALNTLHLLCHVSVMCMYDTMFGLCKLSSAWRWKASWSLSRVLHSPVAHSSIPTVSFPFANHYRYFISVDASFTYCIIFECAAPFIFWLVFCLWSVCAACLSPVFPLKCSHTHCLMYCRCPIPQTSEAY